MKIKIIQKSYGYECGDGCCTEYGTSWYIDSGGIVHMSACEDSGWLAVLQELGIDAEIEYRDENNEVTAILPGPDSRRFIAANGNII